MNSRNIKDQQHCLDDIYKGNISFKAKNHIDQCFLCKSEFHTMEEIEKNIKNLPVFATPTDILFKLRTLMEKQKEKFSAKLSHSLLALGIICLSPYLLGRMIKKFPLIHLNYELSISIFIFIGILVVFLLIPISFQLWQNHTSLIEKFKHDLDNL